MKFTADDDNPGIENASFTIELIGDTGALIYNRDSLPVGTKIDSVVTTFTFQYAIAGMVLFAPKDTILLRNNDTIDFTHQPVHLRVISVDYSKQRNYRISVLVHKINPDLYRWQMLSNDALQHISNKQAVVRHNDAFYWYVNTGFANYLYTSADGADWALQDVPSLPVEADIRTMCTHEGKFYVAHDGVLYISEDGVEWESMDDAHYVSMLGSYKNGVWCIVKDDDGTLYADNLLNRDAAHYQLPQNFPVQGAAKTAYVSPTGQPQFIAIGGVNTAGEQLNTRWITQDMRSWVNLSDGQPAYPSMEGASVVYYGKRLLLIGGFDSNGRLRQNFIVQSYDDGLYWETISTDDLSVPEEFESRAYANVLTSEDGYDLYIIGGTTVTTPLSDVWKARKNSVDWE